MPQITFIPLTSWHQKPNASYFSDIKWNKPFDDYVDSHLHGLLERVSDF